MNLSKIKILSVVLAWLTWSRPAGADTNLVSRTFAHPDRIRYDSQCLTIDGKDIFIYSGAFHYFRCPKPLWRDRFQKIKDAGFNTVETYIPWNWCEQQMPADINDFTKIDLQDFDDWLTMAEQFGFYVIARPGPYICAEWDTGGFPQWLLTKKPKKPLRSEGWLRSDDPVFLAWSKHWYDAVCPVIAKHQVTRKASGQPGVILVQVENEYDYARFSDEAKINQVKALAEDAQGDGIDVPLITCWTRQVRGSRDPVLRQIFDCGNFYPRWNVDGELQPAFSKLRAEQPDAPLATTELQGGWFSQVGGKLSEEQDGVTAAQINNLTLFAIQNGETILNYYMLFGGSNPGEWGARDMTTSYDYNAPIREWGGVGERYQRVWALGHMLQKFGAKLARSKVVECDVTVPQPDVSVVTRRAPDGSRYLFIRTSQHDEPRAGTARVQVKGGATSEIVFDYQLEPFGSKVLYLPPGVTDAAYGEWLPKPAPAIERPADLPSPVSITTALMRADSGPSHWTTMRPGENLAQAGIYDSGLIFYQAKVSSPVATNLLVKYPNGDVVLADVNEKTIERIGDAKSRPVFRLSAGTNIVRLLYENHGHANGGPGMAKASGVGAMSLTGSSFGESKPIEGWRMHLLTNVDEQPQVKVGFNDDNWVPVAVDSEDANQLQPNQTGLFRSGLTLTAADLNAGKALLTFGRVDELGWLYVNGQSAGKATDWSKSCSFDVTKLLHAGSNLVAVVVKNESGGGGIGQPALRLVPEKSSALPETFGRSEGDEKQWWSVGLTETGWKPVAIGEKAAAEIDPLLTWYRMNFSLPSPRPGVWVPWRLHLVAHGNGFLYLNGRALGRYWDAGPQHDFFLPECWLNFGDGQTNNLTLNLRPVNGDVTVQSATVEPYAGFSEKR